MNSNPKRDKLLEGISLYEDMNRAERRKYNRKHRLEEKHNHNHKKKTPIL